MLPGYEPESLWLTSTPQPVTLPEFAFGLFDRKSLRLESASCTFSELKFAMTSRIQTFPSMFD